MGSYLLSFSLVRQRRVSLSLILTCDLMQCQLLFQELVFSDQLGVMLEQLSLSDLKSDSDLVCLLQMPLQSIDALLLVTIGLLKLLLAL